MWAKGVKKHHTPTSERVAVGKPSLPRVGRLCPPCKNFVGSACACTHLISEERPRWRDDPKPEASQTNRLLAGWFRLRPKIIGLQLCDRLKDSHRFVSVFWILANDGANLLHPQPVDEPPRLLRLARKSPTSKFWVFDPVSVKRMYAGRCGQRVRNSA